MNLREELTQSIKAAITAEVIAELRAEIAEELTEHIREEILDGLEDADESRIQAAVQRELLRLYFEENSESLFKQARTTAEDSISDGLRELEVKYDADISNALGQIKNRISNVVEIAFAKWVHETQQQIASLTEQLRIEFENHKKSMEEENMRWRKSLQASATAHAKLLRDEMRDLNREMIRKDLQDIVRDILNKAV